MPNFEVKADNTCVSLAPLETFETTEGSVISYTCETLQQGVHSAIGYCPIEVCQDNGNWHAAHISCAGNNGYHDNKERFCTMGNGLA